MWQGVPEYLLLAAGVAFILHAVSGRYLACTFGGAAASSALNLVHEAWIANWVVNNGWGPPMFIVGVLLALPVCGMVGLPFLGIRYWKGQRADLRLPITLSPRRPPAMPVLRVRFTVRRLIVAVVVAAVMLGVAAAFFVESGSSAGHIRQWIKAHPDQPKPEVVGEGVSDSLISLPWLVIALGFTSVAAVLLWPVRSVAPDPPEPE